MRDATQSEVTEKGIIERAQMLVETYDWKKYQCSCPKGNWSIGLSNGVEASLLLEPGSQIIDIDGTSIQIERGKVVMYDNA